MTEVRMMAEVEQSYEFRRCFLDATTYTKDALTGQPIGVSAHDHYNAVSARIFIPDGLAHRHGLLLTKTARV
jgi:hypothetical protein